MEDKREVELVKAPVTQTLSHLQLNSALIKAIGSICYIRSSYRTKTINAMFLIHLINSVRIFFMYRRWTLILLETINLRTIGRAAT